MVISAESVTFHGPDGCGKSTIAQNLQSLLLEGNQPTIVIGGSSYKEWLSPEIARDFDCDTDLLGSSVLSPDQKTALYEDIAVACYGLTNRLVRDNGTAVLIDSDPYLKRMIWAKKEKSPEDYNKYVTRFEDKMSGRVNGAFPNHVVLINNDATDSAQEETEHIFNRIVVRQANSEYDPTNREELDAIVQAARSVWGEVERSERFRNSGANVVRISNPHEAGTTEALANQANRLAREILLKTLGSFPDMRD